MKRFAPLSALVVLAVAFMPAAALANHHEGRHHHHKRAHRHHARHLTERFGERGSTPSGPGQQGQGTAPAPAGTIQSFDNGTLTIMLADGSLVSGQVTNRTEIECRMDNDEPGNGDNDMRTDDGGPGGSSGGPGPSGSGGSGDNGNGGNDGNDGSGDNDNGNDNDGNEHNDMCSTTALTVNAPVSDAELSLTSAGAVWTRVDLAS
jgi:uncharacterized membrane protein YgcG